MNTTREDNLTRLPIAPISTRVGAFAIDFGSLFACFFATGIAVILVDSLSHGAAKLAWPISLVLILAFSVWNFGFRQGGPAQGSIGKSALRICIVNAETGERIGRGRSLLRLLLQPLDLILFAGLIHAAVDIENQTLVDRMLHTLVVSR